MARRPDRPPRRLAPWVHLRHRGGIGIGLAAAIKLTPAIFILYLLLTRRFRAAAIATATAVGATLLAALLIPTQSLIYWTDALWDTNRIGVMSYVSNQSLQGILSRLDPPNPGSVIWLIAVLAVLVVWAHRSRRAAALKDDRAGFALTGLTACLISPITWVHHLVWLIPALIVLADSRNRQRLLAAAGMYLVLCSSIVWLWSVDFSGLDGFLFGNAYVWIGLTLLFLLPAPRMGSGSIDAGARAWHAPTLLDGVSMHLSAKATVAALSTVAASVLVAVVMSAGPASAGTGVGYLHTDGRLIKDSTNATVRLTGINWFGMETDNKTFHGLWANTPATWRGQIDRMASLGFNTIRVPYSGDALKPGAQATSINGYTNPDLVGLSPLQILDQVVNYAGSKGMRIILDRHRPTSAGQTPLWYTSTVSEASIIADWQLLANRYAGNTTVIGADLFNEPHAESTDPNGTGACWGCGVQSRDWRLAAERIGNAILSVRPQWLIFVEGVSCLSGGTPNAWDGIPDPWQNCDWWGGNLSAAIDQPVRLNTANRLVYAPHDYGISVFDRQPWFNDATFPNNLPGVWDHFWGKLNKQNVAPIMLGEFGSTLANPLDVQWLNTLMGYLTANGMSFTYWSWNPNSGDTGGIALDDWYSINQQKYNILQPHLNPPTGVTPSPSQSTSSSPPPTGTCSAAYTITNSWQGGFGAEVRVTNTGTTPTSNGWRVAWTFGAGQQITSLWQGAYTPSGSAVTVTNLDYNKVINAGQSVAFGFNGSWAGSNPVPSPITCTRL